MKTRSTHARRLGVRFVAPVAALAVLFLAGCTADSDRLAASYEQGDDSGGYVSGDGRIVQPPAAEREEPVAFSGTLDTGDAFDSSEVLGDVVVVNFWYAGCPPCREEAADLESLRAQYDGDEVTFVGVNVSDNADDGAQLRRRSSASATRRSSTSHDNGVQLAFAAAQARPELRAHHPHPRQAGPRGRAPQRAHHEPQRRRRHRRRAARREGLRVGPGRDRRERRACGSPCRSRSPPDCCRSSRRACCRSCPVTSATSRGVTGGPHRTRSRVVLGSLLFVAGFSLVFMAVFVLRRHARALPARLRRRHRARRRGAHHPSRPRLHRPGDGAAAAGEAHLAAARRTHRRPAARHPLRPRLDAVHRPHARSRSDSSPATRASPPAPCSSASPTASASDCPFVLVALGFGWVGTSLGVGAHATSGPSTSRAACCSSSSAC